MSHVRDLLDAINLAAIAETRADDAEHKLDRIEQLCEHYATSVPVAALQAILTDYPAGRA